MCPALALALALATSPPDPPPLTAAERKVLLAEWKKWNDAGMAAFHKADGRLTLKSFEQGLAVAHRLYPRGTFPDGHDNLASSLSNMAAVLDALGKPTDAEPYYREALSVLRRLHPKGDHPDIPVVLNNLAMALNSQGRLTDAEPLLREVLDHYRLRPDSEGGPGRALGLDNLATVLQRRGKVLEAESLRREALKDLRRLYPRQDHRDVAVCLNGLAILLHERGKYAAAEELFLEGVEMRRRLYREQDHPDMADSYHNLASMLSSARKYAEAERYHRDALAMRRRLYPKQDHPDVALSLNQLAATLRHQGELTDADSIVREGLEMRRRMYPKQDHPEVCGSLNELALIHFTAGNYADAEGVYREALDAERRLYLKQDHPSVALCLFNLATVLEARGKHADADPLLREALHMSRRLARASADLLADGEAITRSESAPGVRDGFLTNSLALGTKAADVYAEVFADRGAVSRVYEHKQLRARAVATDPKAAKLLSELADARTRRAELLHAPATKDKAALERREGDLKESEAIIADRSNELRARFTPVARIERLNKATPTDLQKALSKNAVVVDYLRWLYSEYDPKRPGKDGQKYTIKYLAFVVTESEVKWLDLGAADKIEKAVEAWREAIKDANHAVPADLGQAVRELVWEPVRKALPDGVKEVYVSPDASLCRLPWVALPGDNPGTVLLEDEFAVATIPHAPFLLDHLWERDKGIKEKTGTLVVGGVDFDATPAAKLDSKAVQPELLLDAKAAKWKPLAGSKLEADGLLAVAKGQKRETTSISGSDATPAAVLKALPQARHAHLATHGFFADAKFRSAFQLDERDYQISLRGERIGRAANSPLVMTGLVLAGANHPATPGRGIVTGESLVDLDLSGLELAVLSACETGVGDVAGGEGTFGLQRAFHTAGTRNVVASLWSVSDAATAALMGEFYRHLWEKNLTPMQALRQAQLKVLRTDRKELGALALRGPEASGVKDTVEAHFPPMKGDTLRNHPALWAAFTLSGPGR